MRKDLSVSILMPVYNAETYLKEAIDSILNQTYTHFDLLIINDGSSDDSEKIILSYSDKRIVYLKNETNKGLIYTLNKGFSLIEKEYVIRMDADDIAMPDRIQKQVEFMEAHPQVWVCGTQINWFGTTTKQSSFPLTHPEIKAGLLFSSMISHPTAMMRLQKIKEHQLYYNADFLHIEDYELWCRVARVAELANIPIPLLKYRLEGQNISITNWDSREKRYRQVYVKLLEELGIPATDKNLSLHGILNGSVKEASDIEEVVKYACYLKRQNGLKKIYNEKALSMVLRQHISKLFFKTVEKGLPEVLRYFYHTRSVSISQLRYLSGHYKNKLLMK